MIYHNRWDKINNDISRMTDENFLKKIGKRVAETRKRKGYSQTDLGSIIDMETSNLSAIENGRQNPSSLTLKRIADALDCEVKSFF